MRIFNLIEGVWGHKRDVGIVGVKCASILTSYLKIHYLPIVNFIVLDLTFLQLKDDKIR